MTEFGVILEGKWFAFTAGRGKEGASPVVHRCTCCSEHASPSVLIFPASWQRMKSLFGARRVVVDALTLDTKVKVGDARSCRIKCAGWSLLKSVDGRSCELEA